MRAIITGRPQNRSHDGRSPRLNAIGNLSRSLSEEAILTASGERATIFGLSVLKRPLAALSNKLRNAFSKNPMGISDDAFVRFDPLEFDSSIDDLGIQKRFFADEKIWLTKYGDIKNIKNASDLETILYRKNLWPDVRGKFSNGATLRLVDNVDDAVFAGMTNKTDGVRQWRLLRDVPPNDLGQIKGIK